jgi:hypothetical protein
MARRSLSSQVIEEIDRARKICTSLIGASNDLTSILIGNVLDSLDRVDAMCLEARTGPTDAVVSDTPLGTAFGPDKLAQAQTRRRTQHKAGGAK